MQEQALRSRLTRQGISAAAVLLLAGCIPPAPAPASSVLDSSAEIDALFGEWKGLAARASDPDSYALAMVITANLAEREALGRLADFLGGVGTTPEEKVFAVRCLAVYVGAREVEALSRLCEETTDATTRASAATLLGIAGSPEAIEVLRPLTGDHDARVAFAARLSLARLGDDRARMKLAAAYRGDALSIEEGYEVVRLILERPKRGDVKFLTKAVVDPHTDSAHRLMLAGALGALGDTSVVDALERSKSVARNPAYEALAEAAIQALRQREEDGN